MILGPVDSAKLIDVSLLYESLQDSSSTSKKKKVKFQEETSNFQMIMKLYPSGEKTINVYLNNSKFFLQIDVLFMI